MRLTFLKFELFRVSVRQQIRMNCIRTLILTLWQTPKNYYQIEFGIKGLSDPEGIFFEQFGEDDILVLPDPINDWARVLFSNVDHAPALLRVVDRNGAIFGELSSTGKEMIVNMSGWKDGLYYFQLIVNDELKSGKLFKF